MALRPMEWQLKKLSLPLFLGSLDDTPNNLEEEKIGPPKPEIIIKLKCAECGDMFLSTHALIDHISTAHDGKKPHQCQKCGKTFGILSNLNSHTEEFSCHNFWSKPVVIKLNNIKDTGKDTRDKVNQEPIKNGQNT